MGHPAVHSTARLSLDVPALYGHNRNILAAWLTLLIAAETHCPLVQTGPLSSTPPTRARPLGHRTPATSVLSRGPIRCSGWPRSRCWMWNGRTRSDGRRARPRCHRDRLLTEGLSLIHISEPTRR